MFTGNRDYNEIYQQYKDLVFRIAFIYSGRDFHTAEDISQDIFEDLYRGFENFDRTKIKGWMTKVARNKAINYRKKHEKEFFSEDYDSIVESSLVTDSIEEEYLEDIRKEERNNLGGDILLGLMEKNPRWHDAVLYAYYVGMPQDKVAEQMGVSLQVVHSMLHRAREWMKKTYGVEYEEMNIK
ncbi:hypothetical protein B5F07_15625 [Lachnoclostridium sp. An169]|uniref:RNA polymerase sigma factor n=1 Tax=Lachnoclostridium sp. An169 TaxID=1965569 RepID=UPI000B3AAC3E|nr:sigma-70 family RNA polymerase sigma factor [Lachnoclostridium sp. An169]OUP82018.1 hypothetical protein B5F07_15625 [Lachnoclostridium sp. An169]HJA65679.1 sigma-70 family RNA polymerase sigma factor [Candidatus Mediterraneibacter cottocaccae]